MALTPRQLELLGILKRAASCQYGLAVRTNDAAKLRNELYTVRREEGKEFSNLSLTFSPIEPETVVWIYKKDAKPKASKNSGATV